MAPTVLVKWYLLKKLTSQKIWRLSVTMRSVQHSWFMELQLVLKWNFAIYIFASCYKSNFPRIVSGDSLLRRETQLRVCLRVQSTACLIMIRYILYLFVIHQYRLVGTTAAGKAKAGMVHSDCGWTCGCAGKTVNSLENTCHTWALLRWWFTTKRRYIKCMHLYLYLR